MVAPNRLDESERSGSHWVEPRVRNAGLAALHSVNGLMNDDLSPVARAGKKIG